MNKNEILMKLNQYKKDIGFFIIILLLAISYIAKGSASDEYINNIIDMDKRIIILSKQKAEIEQELKYSYEYKECNNKALELLKSWSWVASTASCEYWKITEKTNLK